MVPGEAGSAEAKQRASEVSAQLREELLHAGYGPFLQRRMERLTEQASAWDLRRLEQLVDLAEIHDAKPGLRPADFADEVRAKKVSDPSQARVKVMTIHASKGLEFDAVVLPELGHLWRLTPRGVLLEAESEVAPPRVATMAPRADVAAQHPELEAMYEGEKERQMVDELSGLYVALTRAVHSIDLIVSAPGKKSPSQSHGALVAEAFGGQIVGELTLDGDYEEVWSHADSTEAWAPVHEKGGKEPLTEHRLRLDPAPGETAVRAPSSAGHSPESVGSLLSGASGRGARFGTLVHALFEEIEWLEGAAIDDASLRATLVRVGDEAVDLVDGALARFREAMASDSLVQLLTRPPGEVTVHNERSFEVQVDGEDGAPLRWRGFIDRLVLHREGGRVQRAQVIDYKTDAVASADEVRAAHREQMEAYRSAVATLFGLPSSDVSCALVWLKDPSVAGVGAEVLEV
jgi:ATP-dependent exoDNAse (exonuclease V) beta subunit